MRIGKGKKIGEGHFRFTVVVPFLNVFELEMVKAENRGERSPSYQFLCNGERCGAMWTRTPKGGGDRFLSGVIETPVFPGGKIEVASFVSKEEGHEMDLAWSPQRDAPAPAQGSAPQGSAPQGSDDDIPF